MKKSPFIIGLSLAAILTLSGCNNVSAGNDAVVNKLSHELDRVNNTVSAASSQTNNLSISSISKKFTSIKEDSFAKLTDAYQKAKQLSTNIEDNRERVLKKVKIIKRDIAGGVKLAGENARAISELTAAMQRYTTSLGKTKSDYRNTVRSISKIDKLDGNEIDAKITRLGCCLQARDCYLQNILNTLNNIEKIIGALNDDEVNESEQKDESAEHKEDLPLEQNEEPYPLTPTENVSYPQYNFNGANGYNYNFNGANGYGYNGAYGNGYNFRNTPFNPNRNTDTYGPGVTNIDTYRDFGYGRHFGGSNGINEVDATKENQINDLMLDKTEVKIDEPKEECKDETCAKNDEQKNIAEEAKLDKINEKSPSNDEKIAKKLQISTNSLKKSIEPNDGEGTLDNAAPRTTMDQKVMPTSDKVKGHTNAMIDINQKIEKLIKG